MTPVSQKYCISNNKKVFFGIIGNNVTDFKFFGSRDIDMDKNKKAVFDDSDEFYYYPYFNDAKELF